MTRKPRSVLSSLLLSPKKQNAVTVQWDLCPCCWRQRFLRNVYHCQSYPHSWPFENLFKITMTGTFAAYSDALSNARLTFDAIFDPTAHWHHAMMIHEGPPILPRSQRSLPHVWRIPPRLADVRLQQQKRRITLSDPLRSHHSCSYYWCATYQHHLPQDLSQSPLSSVRPTIPTLPALQLQGPQSHSCHRLKQYF